MMRQILLESIAATISDYRRGEVAVPTPDHVDRWVRQFDGSVQEAMLGELDHVLKHSSLTATAQGKLLVSVVTRVEPW
jgi:hypothetical protein